MKGFCLSIVRLLRTPNNFKRSWVDEIKSNWMRASFLLCTILTFLWLLSSLWKTTIEVCNYLCKYFYPQHYVKKKKKMRAVYISVNGITKSVSGIYFFFIIDPLLILVMSLEGSVSYFFRLFFQVLHFGGSFDFFSLEKGTCEYRLYSKMC